MALVRWNPASELATMEVDRLNRMFSDFYGGESFAKSWTPAVDIYTTDDHAFVIKAELPEMRREDIHLSVENHVLTLRGERKFEDEKKRDDYQRIERFYGAFSRSFSLPPTVDASGISASYKDGVLTVRLPQREDAKPKQIAVGE
jgi:HSP20 family protein